MCTDDPEMIHRRPEAVDSARARQKWIAARQPWFDLQHSKAMVRMRIEGLRHERPEITTEEIKHAFSRWNDGRQMIAFCERHRLNLDWVFFGNLQGLLATVKWRNDPASYWAGGRDLPSDHPAA